MECNQGANISWTEENGCSLLQLRGRVDIFSAEYFLRTARQLVEHGKHTVVQCTDAEHFDTSACQILLALKDGLKEKGKYLHLEGISTPIRHLLHLTGLAAVFCQEETEI